MDTGVFSQSRAAIKERTLRTDRWWLQPAITFGVLFSFVIYAIFASVAPLLTPCAEISNKDSLGLEWVTFTKSPTSLVAIANISSEVNS